ESAVQVAVAEPKLLDRIVECELLIGSKILSGRHLSVMIAVPAVELLCSQRTPGSFEVLLSRNDVVLVQVVVRKSHPDGDAASRFMQQFSGGGPQAALNLDEPYRFLSRHL